MSWLRIHYKEAVALFKKAKLLNSGGVSQQQQPPPNEPTKNLNLKSPSTLDKVNIALIKSPQPPPPIIQAHENLTLLEEKALKLCNSIEQASSLLMKSYLVNDLKALIYEHSKVRHVIYRKNKRVLSSLLELRKFATKLNDKRMVGNINETLALLGYVTQSEIKYRGINILSLDGGGAKGLNTIEVLKSIQNYCGGRPIYELFDYIGGTSTGTSTIYL